MKFRALIATAVIMLSTVVVAESARSESGIGGGTAFTNGTIFPFIAGLETSIESSFFVQNIGDQVMELELSHGAPRGITIEPSEGQTTTLAPGRSSIFNFTISVDETVPAADYPVIVNLRQANLELEDGTGSVYRPALSASFLVRVVGASATLNFSAISSLNGLPAEGDLSLFYLGNNGLDTLIYEERGSEYQIDVVPGNYRANFDVPNLQRQSIEFSIQEGEFKEVILEIPTLDILNVGAQATRDDRGVIQIISLSMEVYNNLRPLQGPIDFVSRVYFQGELVEEFVIESLTVLPEGRTLQRAVYDRADGFQAGRWEFQFIIGNADFEVSSSTPIVIDSPGLLQSFWSEFLLALAVLVIAGLLAPKSWWAIILRRRKSDDEDEVKPLKASELERDEQKPFESASLTSRLRGMAVLRILKGNEKESPIDPSGKAKRADIRLDKDKSRKSSRKSVSERKTSKIKVEKSDSQVATGNYFFAAKRRKTQSDPYELILQTLHDLEKMESEGARVLEFNYDLDKMFAREGGEVINRATGKPYSSADLETISRYQSAKSLLVSLDRKDLEAQAQRQLLLDRLSMDKSSGLGGKS